MEPIGSILSGKQRPQEPEEVTRIKQYVQQQLQAECRVMVGKRDIRIIVAHGALATELQMQISQLQQYCQTDKRLRIQIG